MTQQPKVSVLISFYNLAPFVDQTMESVLAQKTDFPVEILCADDGSDDGTIEKLRGWEAAPSRMVDLSAIRDGTGRLEPDSSVYVFLPGTEYIRIWKYNRWKITG